MQKRILVLVGILAAAPIAAQQAPGARQAAPPANRSGQAFALDAIRPLYEEMKGYLIRSAEQMPQDKYSYRPVPGVRSFGEILGHVINDQYGFCSTARGVRNDQEGRDAEKIATKAEMVAALRKSFEYCDPLYVAGGIPDLAAPAGRGGQNRLFALNYNVAHNSEHYGNLITYFRLNNMVPPSSQPAK
jgi:uncharacterized damage-inducible protein DinB